MELTAVNINKIKDKILKQKQKLMGLKSKIDKELNNYIIEALYKEMELAKKELISFEKELNKEIENYKIVKLTYKKSLLNVKDSLNEFYKLSKNNSKIKKNIQEINNIILNIDKYLG